MIHLLVGAVVAAVGTLVAGAVIVTLSEEITKSVRGWLAGQQLGANYLTDAWMHLERAGAKFRSTVYFRHRDLDGTYKLTMEKLITPDQIEDAGLRAQAQSHGTATADVMHLFG
jgi:hypothetical protein